MKQDSDLRKLKHRVYMSYFKDGLWDMALGLFLLGWGLAVLYDLTWLPGVGFISVFFLVLGLKQKITYPRIGYVKVAEQRKQLSRVIILGIVSFLLGLMVLLLVITAKESLDFMEQYFELLFGSMLAVFILLIGYWWGIVRWYVFSLLVFLFAIANQWLGLSFPLSFIIPGGLIIIYGFATLIYFLRKYPKIPIENFNGN